MVDYPSWPILDRCLSIIFDTSNETSSELILFSLRCMPRMNVNAHRHTGKYVGNDSSPGMLELEGGTADVGLIPSRFEEEESKS